jgi:hypothetical protein
MEPVTTGRSLFAPLRWFNNWTKKREADRLALMRAGSEVVTPVIELAKAVGPTGIMWGDQEQIQQRFVAWERSGIDCVLHC